MPIYKDPRALAKEYAGVSSPQLAGHRHGVLDPSIPGDAANYSWKRSFKSPKELVEQVRKENEAHANRRNTISPLDEFKLYESNMYSGPDFDNTSDYFGMPTYGEGSKYNVPYPKLLEAYQNSKGKYAKANDPEVQKYFNDRLAYRQKLYDRVKKVPEDKWRDFQDEYGRYQDPFDYEPGGEFYDKKGFTDFFDNSANDWETLESFLNEKGY